MNLLIITGMSGAGKSQAANTLEDMGYYCVDNIPPLIIPSLIDLFNDNNNGFNNLAIVTDIRGGELFNDIIDVLHNLTDKNIDYKILFLNSDNDVIIRRYKENRRKHPLCITENISISEAVKKEKEILREIAKKADYVIDTSYTSPTQLKEQISNIFMADRRESMEIQCMSFGYKYGIPAEADLVFDVRNLPNPFYDTALRSHTGKEQIIRDFVMNSQDSVTYLEKIKDMLGFLIPLYIKEGKTQLVIAFGCTGGKHRSVTFTELVYDYLNDNKYFAVKLHRDISK